MTSVTAIGGQPALTRRRRRQRWLVHVLWTAVQVPIGLMIIASCLLVATVVERSMWPWIFGEEVTGAAVPVGLLIGVGAWMLLIYRARVWLHRLRLRRLRRSGESAVGEAVGIAGDPTNPTVFEGYVVFVRWRDLAGEHIGERCYRFRDSAPYDFLLRLRRGQAVVVRYPASRPHRFVIDIPYTPSTADLFI